MEYKDYYKILGIARTATADEIKKAYRRLARKFHPDVSKETNAEARFKEVQEAYEVLKDPEKRAAYDQLGSNWQQGQQFRPPPDWASGFEFRGRPSGGQQDFEGGFSDFFSSLFGGGAESPFSQQHDPFGQPRGARPRAPAVTAMQEWISISKRPIRVAHARLNCSGHKRRPMERWSCKIIP